MLANDAKDKLTAPIAAIMHTKAIQLDFFTLNAFFSSYLLTVIVHYYGMCILPLTDNSNKKGPA